MYSNVTLVGNLARDPESRKVGDNTVTRLVIAVNDPYQKDKVSFIDAEAWGKLADNCQKYLKKGRRVLANGRLVQDTWEKEGKKNSKIYIKADAVQFLSSAKEDGATTTGGDAPPSQNSSNNQDEDIPF